MRVDIPVITIVITKLHVMEVQLVGVSTKMPLIYANALIRVWDVTLVALVALVTMVATTVIAMMVD